MLVKECGHIEWNSSWMEYLKCRIVRAKIIGDGVYGIKTSSMPVRSRGYWIVRSEDLLIITPEIRAKLIDLFKKDRSTFVLKDKRKE